MSQFTHPIKTKPKGTNTLVYSFDKGEVIFAPYDGVVSKIYNDACGKKVEISHTIDNKSYKSVLCNIQDTNLQPGNKVKKNEPIGQTDESGKLTFELLDENNKIVSIDKFMKDYLGDKYYRRRKFSDFSSLEDLSKNIGRMPVNIFKFPFSMISKPGGKRLKEEIDRIKSLL